MGLQIKGMFGKGIQQGQHVQSGGDHLQFLYTLII